MSNVNELVLLLKTSPEKSKKEAALLLIKELVESQNKTGIEEKNETYLAVEKELVKLFTAQDKLQKLTINVLNHFVYSKSPPKKSQPEVIFNKNNEFRTNSLSHVYDNYMTGLEKRTIEIKDNRVELANVLFFAAIHGGLSFVEGIQGLADILVNEPTPFRRSGNHLFIEITYQRKSHNFNYIDNDENELILRRWCPDTLTLAAIHCFLKNKTDLCLEGDAWKLIQLILPDKFPYKPRSLNEFLLSAATLGAKLSGIKMPHFLTHYATGRTPSSSMPLACFHAFNRQKTLPAFEIRMFKSANLTKSNSPQCFIDKAFNSVEFIKQIRFACREFDENDHKRSNKKSINEIKQLFIQFDNLPFTAELLLEWILDNLMMGTWINSSAQRAISAIGNVWLSETIALDFNEVDGADLDVLCEYISREENGHDFTRHQKLQSLLTFASNAFGTPLPDSFEFDTSGSRTVQSQLITESQYQQLRFDVRKSIDDETDEFKLTIDVILILARRLFLRPSELLKILIEDVEISNERWLRIKPNIYIGKKNISAKRKIPLTLLLLEDERQTFEEYFRRRKTKVGGRKKALLFSKLWEFDNPFTTDVLRNLTVDLLSKYAGHPVRFYQFRHSGISVLQLVMFGSDELIENYTPYDLPHAYKIREFLANGSVQNKYAELSSIAGHINSETTLKTYSHFTDILLHDHMSKHNKPYSVAFWCNLSGISSSYISEKLRLSNNSRIVDVTAEQISSFLVKKTTKFIEKTSIKAKKKIGHVKSSRIEGKPSIALCIEVLDMYDKYQDLEKICLELPVTDELVEKWVRNAEFLKNTYKTQKNMYRLYPEKSFLLSPPKITSRDEQKDCNLWMKELGKYFGKKQSEFEWCIDYLLSHVTHSHSYITFSKSEDYKRFMKIVLCFIKPSCWYLEIEPLINKKDKCSEKWELTESINTQILNNSVRREDQFKHGRGKLYFLHAGSENLVEERFKNWTYKKYSSNALKYVFHILAIMMRN